MINKHYDNWLEVELDTNIIDCKLIDDKYYYELEDTIFFFESGGQKRDKGYINGYEVIDLVILDGKYYHVLDIKLEGKVHLSVDKNYRVKLAEIHSGHHLMCSLINKRFSAKTIAFFNDDNEAGAEMAFDSIDDNIIKEIEELCNRYILEDISVEISYPSKKEALKRVGLNKVDHEFLRSVTIGDIDYDMCACIHVPSLRYLQSFKITRYEKTSRGYKIFFLTGHLLRETLQKYHDTIKHISTTLSSPMYELDSNFDKFNSEYKDLITTNTLLNDKYIEVLSYKYINDDRSIIVDEFEMDNKLMGKLASLIVSNSKKLLIFINKNDTKLYMIVTHSKDLDIDSNQIFKKISEVYNFKGGGNKIIAQGGGLYDNSIKEYIEKNIIGDYYG